MKRIVAKLLISAAFRIWRTDASFHGWPYGPPDHGFKYGFAWWAYHWGRSALSKEPGDG